VIVLFCVLLGAVMVGVAGVVVHASSPVESRRFTRDAERFEAELRRRG